MLTNTQIETLTAWASARQCLDTQIAQGIAYAQQQGADDEQSGASLMMSRILYSDEQLEDGARFEVETLDD